MLKHLLRIMQRRPPAGWLVSIFLLAGALVMMGVMDLTAQASGPYRLLLPLLPADPSPTVDVPATQTAAAIATATADAAFDTQTPTGTMTNTPDPLATSTPTGTVTNTPDPQATSTPTGTATSTATTTATSTNVPSETATTTPTPTVTPTKVETTPLEDFEGALGGWQVGILTGATGSVTQSSTYALGGSYSARMGTGSSSSSAAVYATFSDAGGAHTWGERPGTWIWQRAYVYLPSATVAQLGSSEYLALAGFWPTATGGRGWWLRVRQGGELYVYGYDADGNGGEFRIYGQMPQDRWVEVEIGLHSQAGPGVKRAFAVLLDGDFYGWYHQGRMTDETYNRAAMGILATNSSDALEVYVDQWDALTSATLPGGSDTRSTATLQEQDYRADSGVQWQIDWSTWRYDLRLDATHGLYSATNRLQSGRNLDRMPDLTDGWAEIEIGWPNGTPGTQPNSYFGAMVGFRKEINREQNLEIIPIGQGNGQVDLVFEAWTGSPVILAEWPLPEASIGGTHIPEPGDIIRAQWEQVTATDIRVLASYYDASAAQWYVDVIDHQFNATSIASSGGFGPVDYTDGYHTAASVTIDSTSYSIRRFKVGTLDTVP